jgi:hypothetical protein
MLRKAHQTSTPAFLFSHWAIFSGEHSRQLSEQFSGSQADFENSF